MRTRTRKLLGLSALLVLLVGPAAIGRPGGSVIAPLAPAPISAASPAAALPTVTCTATGASERTCDLWAKTDTLALPGGGTVPMWGFAYTDGGTASLPGPPLIVNQGETVIVHLHNQIPGQNVSLYFTGQGLIPDLTGVGTGSVADYTFTAAEPGTYSYEAGLTSNGARQVAMGLFGALIVRPADHPTWAYGDATEFDDEALLILSEIDPAFNNDPAGFDMVTYAPEYWLVNGKAYPDADLISTTAGNRLLVRMINAGLDHHAVGLLGLHQTVVGIDGNPVPHSYQLVADTIPAGQSLDALVTIPEEEGMRYALYETAHHMHNAVKSTFGGILTFITTAGSPAAYDLPLATDVQVEPNPTNGAAGVTLSATITGGTDIDTAEYFVDSLGAPGTGTTMSDGFGSPPVVVTATISAGALAALPTGQNVFYVRGHDTSVGWGPVGSAVLNLVVSGPVISGMALTPDPTNGSTDVAIQATGDARPSGPVNVVAAEYFIDTTGAPDTGEVMTLNHDAPVASLTATIPQGTVAALSEGAHTIHIHAQDSLDNWGGFGQIALHVDQSGPIASSVSVAPNPNNGNLGILPSIPSVRLEAIFADPVMGGVNSNIERAEGFIDTVGAYGSGFPLIATDGVFNRPYETAYSHIPLFTIRQLSPGLHTLHVRAKDVSGNWGPTGSVGLIVDKTLPQISNLNVAPNPTGGATGVALTATATDPLNPSAPASNIVAAEWFEGTDPGAGHGNAMVAADGGFSSPTENVSAAINVIGWTLGDHVLSVRARDAAGNWGSVATTTLTVQGTSPQLIFADGFEAGNFAAWAAVVGAVRIAPEAAMGPGLLGAASPAASTLGMAADVNGTAPAYVVDDTPNHEAFYIARFYFHPNGTDTAGDHHEIFLGRDGSGTTIFGIQYQHVVGDTYEIRAWVRHSGGQAFTNWYEISNAPHLLTIWWESSPAATFHLFIGSPWHEALSGLNTSAYLVDEVWLGPSLGLTAGMKGTEYYDEFVSLRSPGCYHFLPLVTRNG
ncbi:MAG: hypothetical protein CEE40_05530 [Chloroflexi bacterium B3_Chlor]|nr:MAG: hypothetical protein CEE40_05530 [Chloroflexi bacterium B3_Chlor]